MLAGIPDVPGVVELLMPDSQPTTEHTVNQIPLLSHDECHQIVRKIESLEKYWTRRDPDLPFFTLGAASYLDAWFASSEYYEKTARFNPILEGEFGWLYDRLLPILADQFKGEMHF